MPITSRLSAVLLKLILPEVLFVALNCLTALTPAISCPSLLLVVSVCDKIFPVGCWLMAPPAVMYTEPVVVKSLTSASSSAVT